MHSGHTWVLFALLSAFFAGLSYTLAKLGIKNVNSNLAAAIITTVVSTLSWIVTFVTGKQNDIVNIEHKSLLFFVLSGTATGLSWLCFYRALQLGEASKVIPVDKFSLVIGMAMAFIILKEPVSAQTIIGGMFITIGMFVLIL